MSDNLLQEVNLLVDRFDNLPVLKFPPKPTSEVYQFPVLRIPTNAEENQLPIQQDWSHVKLPDGKKYPKGVQELCDALTEATSKFGFAKHSEDHWNQFLRFSNDRLAKSPSDNKNSIINNNNGSMWEDGQPINRCITCLQSWFEQKYIPSLELDVESHSTYILGRPGCGKSTIFKYLISAYDELIRRNNIVFSRFEFMKFLNRWNNNSNGFEDNLEQYMSFINLRDLVRRHFFLLHDCKEWKIRFEFSTEQLLREECHKLEKRFQIGKLPGRYNISEQIFHAVQRAKESSSELDSYICTIESNQRVELISVLAPFYMTVTVFDGLDFLKFEDVASDGKKSKIIQYILQNRDALCGHRKISEIGVYHPNNSVVIMRQNTIGILEMANPGIKALNKSPYFVGMIQPKVALWNTIRRTLHFLSATYGRRLPDSLEIATCQNMSKSVDRLFRVLTLGSGSNLTHRQKYDIFDGNIRELVFFLVTVFHWTVRQMIRDGLITTKEYENALLVVETMSSAKAYNLLVRRKYRVVEMLLFTLNDRFENAAEYQAVDPYVESFLTVKSAESKLQSNPLFSGFIDNLFNYHITDHDNDPDKHAILEKIRILQIVEENPKGLAAIKSELESTFGYLNDQLHMTLTVLMKGNFLRAEILRGERQIRFHLTGRGKFALHALVPNMAYLEHVFHKTLFPVRLIDNVEDDVRRGKAIKWTCQSIRNVFIMLSYLKYVEENPANGKTVPQKMRVYPKMLGQVKKALSRILGDDRDIEYRNYENEPTYSISEERAAIVQRSAKLINGTLNTWKLKGLISD